MKKIVSILLAMCMILSALFTLTSCQVTGTHTHSFSTDWSSNDTHHWHGCTDGCEMATDFAMHTFGEWTTAGEEQHKRTCSVCAYEVTDGHTWGEGEVTTEPTPEADGVETFTCTDCGATKTRPIAYGHTHQYGDFVSISDTQHKKVCECEAEIVANHEFSTAVSVSDTQHKKSCVCGHEITEDHAWDSGETNGEQVLYTCLVCGNTKTETITVQNATVNPYSNINWSTDEQIRSMSHWHLLTQAEFDMAIADGYRHFAISHYQPSVPREDLSLYFSNVPDNVVSSPNSEKPNSSNVGGVYHFNALGSYATGGGHNADEKANLVPWQTKYDEVFANLKYPDGGGITLNHPLYYPTQTLATLLEMLDYDERVLGVEMFNGDYGILNPGNGQDKIYDTRFIDTWDAILSTGRRCWGFAVIDWYNTNYEKGSNVLLVDTSAGLTDEECLKAYRNGQFYMQVKDTGLRFTKISYENGAVTVEVNKDATIKFVTQDGAVKTVSGTTATYVPTEDDIYVRVEAADAEDADGRIFSNPFMFKTREEVAAEYDGMVNLKDSGVVYDINNSNVEGSTATTVVWGKEGVYTTTTPADTTGYTKYTVEWYNYGTAGANLDGTSYNITKRLEIKSIKAGDAPEEATITWNGKTYAKGDIVMRTSASHWLGCDAFMGWAYPSTVFKPSYAINPIAENGEIASYEATFKIDLGDCHKNGDQYVLSNFLSIGIRATGNSTPVAKVAFRAAGTAENYIDVAGPSGTFYTTSPAGRGVVGEEFTVRIEISESLTAGKYTVKTYVNGTLIDTCDVTAFDFNNIYVSDIPALARDISVTMSGIKILKYVENYDKHTHTFDTEWSSDADNHWHKVNCNEHDGCAHVANKDFGAHVDTDTNGKCDVCNKVLSGAITVDNPQNLVHTIPTTPVEAGTAVTFTVSVTGNYGVHVTGATQVGEPVVDGDTKTYTFKIEAVDPGKTVRIEKKKTNVVNKVDYTDTAIRFAEDGEVTTYVNVSGNTVSAATEASYDYAIRWKNRAVAGPSLDGTTLTYGRSKLILSITAKGSTEETQFTVNNTTYKQGGVIGQRPFLDNTTIDGVNHIIVFGTKTITSVVDSIGGPVYALAGNEVLTAPTEDSTLRFVFDTNMTVAAGKLNATQQIKILYTAETNRTSTMDADFVERRGNDVYIIFGGQDYRVAAVGETFNYRVEFRQIATDLTEDPNEAGKSYKPYEMKLFINDELIATREDQIDAGSGNYDAEPQRVQFNTLSSSCDIMITFDSTYVDRYVAP